VSTRYAWRRTSRRRAVRIVDRPARGERIAVQLRVLGAPILHTYNIQAGSALTVPLNGLIDVPGYGLVPVFVNVEIQASIV
jgi:hypothetical protein